MNTTNLLTYKIIGFANIIVPNSHLKGFLAQFCILNLVEELLCKQGDKRNNYNGVYASEKRNPVGE